MDTGHPKPLRLDLDRLEDRVVPAIASIQLSNQILTVRTDNSDSVVQVRHDANTVQILDGNNGQIRIFARSNVSRVDVWGGNGNDSLSSLGGSKLFVRLFGKGGDDYLEGDSGRNMLVGGDGNDRLFGRGGNDDMSGLAGDDYLFGGIGNDKLDGGDGNDTVIGGPDVNAITGGTGDDVLVSINGSGLDTLDAGTGFDVVWIDQANGFTDSVTGIDGSEIIHLVTSFANGADNTLNGDTILSPALGITNRPNDVYEVFASRPLFPVAGAAITDIQQNVSPGTIDSPVLNDGWMLATAGAILNDFPQFFRANMVDFGDGTFGINFNGTYIRVDNRLPVSQFGSLSPAFAKLGPDNSMWVAILEKAFATVANVNAPSYNLINGGAFPSSAMSALGFTPQTFLTPGVFVDEFQLGDFLKQARANNIPTVYTVFPPTSGLPLTVPLVIGQSYTLEALILAQNGDVTSVVLRNPTGVDGGGSTDSNPNDGLVTITILDLYTVEGRLDFAT